jgi:hypothetical protein
MECKLPMLEFLMSLVFYDDVNGFVNHIGQKKNPDALGFESKMQTERQVYECRHTLSA